jgi:hypothetical protein
MSRAARLLLRMGYGHHRAEVAAASAGGRQHTGSLSRRMLLIAFAWVSFLLVGGGLALDHTLTGLVTRNFDDQLGYMLTAMIASAEIGPDGEVFFNRPLGDQRFLEPNSGLYWQISGQGHDDFPSRSLWDRTLRLRGDHFDSTPHIYDSDQFGTNEKLRMIERSVILPGSNTLWQFSVAASRGELDAQIARIRSILIWSFLVLAMGLFIMAGLQTYYGLGPLRRVRRAIAAMREGGAPVWTSRCRLRFSLWYRKSMPCLIILTSRLKKRAPTPGTWPMR